MQYSWIVVTCLLTLLESCNNGSNPVTCCEVKDGIGVDVCYTRISAFADGKENKKYTRSMLKFDIQFLWISVVFEQGQVLNSLAGSLSLSCPSSGYSTAKTTFDLDQLYNIFWRSACYCCCMLLCFYSSFQMSSYWKTVETTERHCIW